MMKILIVHTICDVVDRLTRDLKALGYTVVRFERLADYASLFNFIRPDIYLLEGDASPEFFRRLEIESTSAELAELESMCW